MRIAGTLMEKGIDFTRIADVSFYTKTYRQNQIMGRTILESIMLLDGKCIVGVVSQRVMEFYGVTPKDLDGIVDQLRVTRGVEVAIFLYAVGTQEYKVSMRSNGGVDVSAVAQSFGGGGHVRAAGCTMQGSFYDVVNNLTGPIEKQLQEMEPVSYTHLAAIEQAIKTMPNYFDEYDTTVHFITEEEFEANHKGMPHGGFVMRSGKTGDGEHTDQMIEFSLKLGSNPEFTSSVLVAYARAAYRMRKEGQTGCRTVFDVAPAYLSPEMCIRDRNQCVIINTLMQI